jgi:mannose-6-phosphate isomerase-like protein (cupin superfamily)
MKKNAWRAAIMQRKERRMSYVVKTKEAMEWESPPNDDPSVQDHRYMSLMFERDITPTKSMAAGVVTISAGQEQTKLSTHEGEEIYFVLEGTGEFVLNDEIYPIEKDTAVYVSPGTKHRARNTDDTVMRLLFVNCPSVFGPVGGYHEFMKQWKRVR